MIFTVRGTHDRIADMQAVLFDMDGTLVDSEKLWDISLAALYEELGGRLTPRSARIDGGRLRGEHHAHVYTDLGLELDPVAMAESIRWLHDYTGGPVRRRVAVVRRRAGVVGSACRRRHSDGAGHQHPARAHRAALNSIGRHYFSATVCGDEVPRGKPAPDAYLRAAALLGLAAGRCLAIEDSVTGTAAAEGAGCPVLVVPNDVAVPGGPRRRHISSLAEVDVADLRARYSPN